MSVEFADGTRSAKYDRCSTEATVMSVENINSKQTQFESIVETIVKPDHELLQRVDVTVKKDHDILQGYESGGLSYDALISHIEDMDIFLLRVFTSPIMRLINWIHPFCVVYRYVGRWCVGLIQNDKLTTAEKRRMIKTAYKNYLDDTTKI